MQALKYATVSTQTHKCDKQKDKMKAALRIYFNTDCFLVYWWFSNVQKWLTILLSPLQWIWCNIRTLHTKYLQNFCIVYLFYCASISVTSDTTYTSFSQSQFILNKIFPLYD